MGKVDVQANRRSRKYSTGELAARVLWGAARPAFRFSPRLCYGWRRLLLRSFGARIGRETRIEPSVRISYPWLLEVGTQCALGTSVIVYNLGAIRIGDRTTISQGAHLCGGTHNHRQPDFPLLRTGLTIGSDVWIAADAFVGPAVTVADGAIVGARAVVVKDVALRSIVVGNPARTVGTR